MSRPFTEVLAEIGGTDANEELTDRLAVMVEEVLAHAKAGELSLAITVKPNGMNAVKVDYKIKAKMPEPDRPQSIFFVDEQHGLRRNDPRQSKMDLRDVTADQPENFKEVEPA